MEKYSTSLREVFERGMKLNERVERTYKAQVPTCSGHHVVLGFRGVQRSVTQVLQRPYRITGQVTRQGARQVLRRCRRF